MKFKAAGLVLGLALFLAVLFIPTPASFMTAAAQALGTPPPATTISAAQLAGSMQAVLAVLALMVVWWLTEAVPLPATALLPAVLLPLLKVTGLQGHAVYEFSPKNALQNYANPVIYLFLGGFLIAGAMQKWKLDRRFTLWFLTRGNVAGRAGSILFGMMAVTALLSMWISNTAAAALMLPLGIGVLSLVDAQPGNSRFGTALMLGIAWAASIGGVGTIIGTPPNGIALGVLNATFAHDPSYQRITFLDWMKFGVPLVLLLLPIAWAVLMRLHPPEIGRLPGGKARLQAERVALGPLSRGEKGTIAIFALAVILWVTNPFWPALLPDAALQRIAWVDEYLIGLVCGTLLFFIPVSLREGRFLLDWSDTRFVDWGTLILFGGGIALSDAMFKTGLAAWIATSFVALLGTPSTIVLTFAVVCFIAMLTEVTSNTAVTTMMVPVVVSIALRTGANPVTVAVATAISASMAFMLPVATPPNALVFGTGYVRLRDMVRSGLVLDALGCVVTMFIIFVVASRLLGVLSL
ncbi:SLC13 family permease [Opitutus terrae]|uniref:Anion transporter n=1 Tax=Opitutus terrae (strain DSM 11246 / JCM 15787 / PB90-1) TaxID=452637 RepID=B1ZPL8_OPITP|nr:DASS family sodium-coupled anion symporter [Opitutus terrae]ACB74537.1 anion transporter [Opitutus terrae PB90-1]